MGRTVYVYGLKDPRDNLIRYVGQTVSMTARMSGHTTAETRTRKGRWLRELDGLGMPAEPVILQTCAEEESREVEEKWIEIYRPQLFNDGPAARITRREGTFVGAHVQLLEEERSECNAVALKVGIPFAAWARRVLVAACRDGSKST
jgi:hypothetical protein